VIKELVSKEQKVRKHIHTSFKYQRIRISMRYLNPKSKQEVVKKITQTSAIGQKPEAP
jgi:hypothetical protein